MIQNFIVKYLSIKLGLFRHFHSIVWSHHSYEDYEKAEMWRKTNLSIFFFLDLDERILKQQQEEEERKRQRRERKKEKKVSMMELLIPFNIMTLY